MEIDTSKWSGEGAFTRALLDSLAGLPGIVLIKVEDSPSTRSDADYNFIDNELFVAFETRERQEKVRRLGVLPGSRTVLERTIGLADLESALSALQHIGPPDYSDEGMLQYLRTERIVPPYQTRGYKLVELVRIYEVGTHPRRSAKNAEA